MMYQYQDEGRRLWVSINGLQVLNDTPDASCQHLDARWADMGLEFPLLVHRGIKF